MEDLEEMEAQEDKEIITMEILQQVMELISLDGQENQVEVVEEVI